MVGGGAGRGPPAFAITMSIGPSERLGRLGREPHGLGRVAEVRLDADRAVAQPGDGVVEPGPVAPADRDAHALGRQCRRRAEAEPGRSCCHDGPPPTDAEVHRASLPRAAGSLRAVPDPLLVILAAGGGTRYDGPTHKLLAPWRGTTSWCRGGSRRSAPRPGRSSWSRARSTSPTSCVLVRGARSSRTTGGPTARRRRSPLAVAARRRARATTSVVVGLGDQPDVPAVGVASRRRRAGRADRRRAASRRASARPYGWTDRSGRCCRATGDEGARVVMRAHPELVRDRGRAGRSSRHRYRRGPRPLVPTR